MVSVRLGGAGFCGLVSIEVRWLRMGDIGAIGGGLVLVAVAGALV